MRGSGHSSDDRTSVRSLTEHASINNLLINTHHRSMKSCLASLYGICSLSQVAQDSTLLLDSVEILTAIPKTIYRF